MALHEAGSALIAYFYCDFRDEDKQSRRNILLSILSQLSTQSNLNFLSTHSPAFIRTTTRVHDSQVTLP
jgi:hypothetical protein